MACSGVQLAFRAGMVGQVSLSLSLQYDRRRPPTSSKSLHTPTTDISNISHLDDKKPLEGRWDSRRFFSGREAMSSA